MSLRVHLAHLYPEVRAYARSLARDRAAAEDLAGDAMVRALSHPTAPDEEARLRPWLLRTVRNLHIDRWRAERVRREHAAMEYAGGADRLSAEGFAGAEDDALGRMAFARLSAGHREVLVLVDVLGHSYAEAAALIGVPRGTIMSRVARARAAMTGHVLGEPDDDDEGCGDGG